MVTAFILSQIEGFTDQQIATLLGVFVRTIKSYMSTAMLECVQIEKSHRETLQ